MRSLLGRVGPTIVIVALARLGAWALVAAMTSSVVVLWRDRWREDQHRRPSRLAALAVLSVDESAPGPGVQALLLGSMSAPKGSLERAKELLRGHSSQARWAIGAEAVALTEQATEMAPWLQAERATRSCLPLAAWSMATAALSVSVSFTGSIWLAVLFVASCVGAVAALTDLRHDRWGAPQRLATAATSPTGQQPLTELSHQARVCSSATIDRAQRILRTWDLDDPVRRDAQTLLALERSDTARDTLSRWRTVARNGAGALAGAATWVVPL